MRRSSAEYDQIILKLFRSLYRPGALNLPFSKAQLEKFARPFGIKNVPDILYSFRSRNPLPPAILRTGNWVIAGRGKGKYAFQKIRTSPQIDVPHDLASIDIPDATPEIVEKYSGSDEQGLLARIRYNRLVDVFTSITAYLLQSHLRTTLKGAGQIEIDDLYIGVDTDGRWYVLPIEAKGPRESLGRVQIANMSAYAKERYPELTLRPLAAKQHSDGTVFLFEFNTSTEAENIAIVDVKRYQLFREQKQS